MILVVLAKTWFPQDIGTAQYPGGCFLVIEENVCLEYRKIPKISQGLYFSKTLFEGLIFGAAYLRREICVSKSIGLALKLEVKLKFLLRFTLYLRTIFQVQAPGGLIFGGAI